MMFAGLTILIFCFVPGICKTQWLECWILRLALRRRTEKLPRELDQLHSYMKKVTSER